MIDFRYHVVSIIAIFLALATGIVVGSSLVNGPVLNDLNKRTQELKNEQAGLHTQISDLHNQTGYRDAFITKVTPSLVKGKLAGQTVVLVPLPGADSDLVGSVDTLVRQAGGAVSGQVSISDGYADAGHQTALDTQVTSLAPVTAKVPRTGAATDRAAELLAWALVSKQAGPVGGSGANVPAIDTDNSAAVLGGLKRAGFIDLRGNPQNGATLAILIAPNAPANPPADLAGRDRAYLSLAGALDAGSRGGVLAGPTGSAVAPGLLAMERSDGHLAGLVSSVDDADQPAGQVAVVWALVAETQGHKGHYGMSAGSTDGPLPTLAGETAP